ncbi:MAG: L,D-transpeptidase family protein [Pseudomonadota bacterium]
MFRNFFAAALACLIGATVASAPAIAQDWDLRVDPFRLAMAQETARRATDADDPVAAFYRARDYRPLWLGAAAAPRRAAFVAAMARGEAHGLPKNLTDADSLRSLFESARSATDRAAVEVEATTRLLTFMRAAATGILNPKDAAPGIKFDRPARDWSVHLAAFAGADPQAALDDIWPKDPAYSNLLRAKLRLDEQRLAGGWGPQVRAGAVKPGQGGAAVIALRDRLIRMGYLDRTLATDYGPALTAAVRLFQQDHGLTADGVAGPDTLAALNVPLSDRLAQLVIGMERRRWLNKPLEPRHILVNIAEQHAYVYDDGAVTFDTVVVVGSTESDRRTPEFSDEMDHMVINPTWNVPRSIAVKEYLPSLRRGGANHLRLYYRGRQVSRDGIDFSQYTAQSFPFSLKQPPGPSNALGKVKFMFPNRWNIYLHDTPSKSLFGRDRRTFSHGCVRVERPFDLAYHLLAPQEADPVGTFQSILNRGAERRVNLEQPIGVHLVYWSAWVGADGRLKFREDPYGRDRNVLLSLQAAGVELDPERS